MRILYTFHDSGSGWQVAIPSEMEGSFKETFKSAKWQEDSKTWHVGPRSENRLVDWIEEPGERAKDVEYAYEDCRKKHEIAVDARAKYKDYQGGDTAHRRLWSAEYDEKKAFDTLARKYFELRECERKRNSGPTAEKNKK